MNILNIYTLLIIIGLIIIILLYIVLFNGNDNLLIIGSILGLLFLSVGMIGIMKESKKYNNENYDKEYQQLLYNIDVAEKELQKFYIDHPEYKLEENEVE